MKINARDGRLRLRSAFKLMFVGWLISWGVLMGGLLLLMIVIALAGGTVDVNGEPRQGLDAALALAPAFPMVAILLPIHAAVFSGIICLGLAGYRLFKPIKVVDECFVPSADQSRSDDAP